MLDALAFVAVLACSQASWDPDEFVENEVVSSANGRFLAVVRWHEGVPDFATRRRGEPSGESSEQVTVAVYESTSRSRRRIVEIPIARDSIDEVVVTDDGRFLIAIESLARGGCGDSADADEPFISIFETNGNRAGVLTGNDVFNAYDLWHINAGWGPPGFVLRAESDTREVLVLRIPRSDGGFVERRIDIRSAALLDPKTDIFPKPRVYVTPATDPPLRPYNTVDCAAEFDDPDVIPLAPPRFFERAVFGPLPPFPEIAMKARIRTGVQVQVVVSEGGRVLCSRSQQMVFGIDAAAAQAAQRWRFRPLTIDGRRVKFAGELLFHFRDVDEETWRAAMHDAPPHEE